MEELLANIISGNQISIDIDFNINYLFKSSSDINDDSCILIKKADQEYYKYDISSTSYGYLNRIGNLNRRLFLQKLYLNNEQHDKFKNLCKIRDQN